MGKELEVEESTADTTEGVTGCWGFCGFGPRWTGGGLDERWLTLIEHGEAGAMRHTGRTVEDGHQNGVIERRVYYLYKCNSGKQTTPQRGSVR